MQAIKLSERKERLLRDTVRCGYTAARTPSEKIEAFIEPCAGKNALTGHLAQNGQNGRARVRHLST